MKTVPNTNKDNKTFTHAASLPWMPFLLLFLPESHLSFRAQLAATSSFLSLCSCDIS